MNDSDNDHIADSNENSSSGVSSDPNDPDTFVLGGDYVNYGDDEIRCLLKELNHGITVLPNSDWAKPGQQWP